MPFAGFAVSQHHLPFVGVVIAGVAGNLVGSWIAYAVGYYGGEPFVRPLGQVRAACASTTSTPPSSWFGKYGAGAVFFCRMLPIVRTFISLPAGFAQDAVWKFTLYTVLGCVPWVILLAFVGVKLGDNWEKIRT